MYLYVLVGRLAPLCLSFAFHCPPLFLRRLFGFSIFRFFFPAIRSPPPSPLVTVPLTEPVVFVAVGSWYLYKHIPDSVHFLAVPFSVHRCVAANLNPDNGAYIRLDLIYMCAVPQANARWRRLECNPITCSWSRLSQSPVTLRGGAPVAFSFKSCHGLRLLVNWQFWCFRGWAIFIGKKVDDQHYGILAARIPTLIHNTTPKAGTFSRTR